jgi:hypothetical protein
MAARPGVSVNPLFYLYLGPPGTGGTACARPWQGKGTDG